MVGLESSYLEGLQEAAARRRRDQTLLVLFLGSSIGNFGPQEMAAFFTAISCALSTNDFFLLGIDLVKERNFIEAAYNDAGTIVKNGVPLGSKP